MPCRPNPFVNGQYYHIYNRGVNKVKIFNKHYDYQRFIKSMLYYQIDGPKPRYSLFNPNVVKLDQRKKIVQIICYSLMPNHIHFLIRQERDNGVTEFMSRLTNSYTKYHNIKYNRVGYLFQGEFKAVLVENNEQLLHLSRYIHINSLVSGLTGDLENFKWSSYPEYIGLTKTEICTKEVISGQFTNKADYKNFVLDQTEYGIELEFIKHHLLDPEN